MTPRFAALPLSLLLVAACSGPAPVRDAFSGSGEVIALGGGSGGAAYACATCHGLKGEGDGNRAPRLAGLDRGYLLRQMTFYRDGQRSDPRMMHVARTLGADEVNRVAAYYAGLPLPPAACAAPSLAAQSLYRAGDPARGIPACAACHGVAGEGNAGNPPLAGQPALYLERQLADWRSGNRYGDPLGVMTRIAKTLTAAESAALSAGAARPPDGRGYPGSTAGCPPARHAGPTDGA